MRGDEHRARELRPLECVQDNYEKLVITLDKALDDDYNGIRVVHIIDWLFFVKRMAVYASAQARLMRYGCFCVRL